ncbi:MAG: AAA-like domain-containing protein [Candidatus Poribacteria bacterium]|nr:AAA-like domain-containing protein [Candidatus Poribacteria bacterium]
MRRFGTQGPVNPQDNYVVARNEELTDFIDRVKQGRYIVLFAPRQTGKKTFFQDALKVLAAEGTDYFPIQLNFEEYEYITPIEFYQSLCREICREIQKVFRVRGDQISSELDNFLVNAQMTNHLSMREFFEHFTRFAEHQRVVLIVDEFDGIPRDALNGFLRSLRRIYLTGREGRAPYSVGIVGVKNITQLNYDRSISPFNIQDEFTLPNFSIEQVHELLTQYTDEVGQQFAPKVVEKVHKQTAGQPFLVNRFAQILTEELGIPKTETIQMSHFSQAHEQLLSERNTNISHLITNVLRDPRFEKMLMRIAFYQESRRFNFDDDIISELATYGIIGADKGGMCQILNPIYLHRVLQAFQPLINGLEDEYFSQDGPVDFSEYMTATGQLQMRTLMENFKDFIARAGFRILQVPDTPQEFVGQYLLFAYLDEFVKIVGAAMYLEVPTGRGRADLVISHSGQTYVVETKVWRSERSYQAGKQQLAAYLKLENATEGYYMVFDYRETPEPRAETDTVDDCTIHSYVIPVLQAAINISSLRD